MVTPLETGIDGVQYSISLKAESRPEQVAALYGQFMSVAPRSIVLAEIPSCLV